MIKAADSGPTEAVRNAWLRGALGLHDEDAPFPWQEALFTRFLKGLVESEVDIPTGLGKTSVIALWLVARACGAELPRRLVYVVDRRAVVDQATDVAIRLRDFVDQPPGPDQTSDLRAALGLEGRPLPISTLRGQQVDNKDWLEDPASPAIIVGTVDMIGSRLLFSGYGVSRKMRPYHAGLLGADTLVVLDEAHLVPPFEMLLQTIQKKSGQFGPREDTEHHEIIPAFKLLSLSATGRTSGQAAFGLTDKDREPGSITKKRLDAPKHLSFVALPSTGKLPGALAEQAWKLTDEGNRPIRCVVFCNSRTDAEAVKKALDKLSNAGPEQGAELLIGARRVFERQAASKRLRELGFIAGADVQLQRPAFLIATAAGEVGVDLEADHAVTDLVAWERMVQRFGRVNRRGNGDARIVVVTQKKASPKERETQEERVERERPEAYEAALRLLPKRSDGGLDASPGAIHELKQAASGTKLEGVLVAATTPPPLRPALTRALADAWSMTSLREHTGRPNIGPWLRGWKEDEPQTTIVWRKHLPVLSGAADRKTRDFIETFFEAAPPHMSELLETETHRVAGWLARRGAALRKLSRPARDGDNQNDEMTGPESDLPPLRDSDVAAIVLTPSGDLIRTLRLEDLENLKAKDAWKQMLPGMTVVVDRRMKGLTTEGLLDDEAGNLPRTVDDGSEWRSSTDTSGPPDVHFQVTDEPSEDPPGGTWRELSRFVLEESDEEAIRWLVVYKWRHAGTTEDDRSISRRAQLLDAHEEWTEQQARDIAHRLDLPEPYVEMLAVAARLHDEGKKAAIWKRAAGVLGCDDDYGKTLRLNPALLHGYRHELGSFLRVKGYLQFADPPPNLRDAVLRLEGMPPDLLDLTLHLIAAHHGGARPIISTEGCDEAPPAILQEAATEIALRFARLQKRWGPWGLAWWESLLRAADQQASRRNDQAISSAKDGA